MISIALPFLIRRHLTTAVALASLTAATASAQPAAPVLQAHVVGQTVHAAWTPVAGATGYRVEAGLSQNQVLAAREVGAVTSFSLPAPQGIYFIRVLARNAQGLGTPSNVVGVSVSSTAAPPAPPTGLAATAAGSSVSLSLSLPAGPLTGLVLAAGLAPGQTQMVIPLPVASHATLPNVPTGVYFARAHAIGPGGPSGASNEVQIVVSPSACVPPAPPGVQVQSSGSTVGVGWTAVAGAAGYRVNAYTAPGGPALYAIPFPASTTSATFPGIPAGTYYASVTAVNACGSATSALGTVVVTPPPAGYRTPNPPAPSPPNYLPLPNREAVVLEMARLYPHDLRASCVEHGGNNIWLFRLVQRLRQEDTRWGLNWKRARVGDMSQDIITYNYGPEADEGTQWVYGIDVIAGHCGPNPQGAWINQTPPNLMWTPGARWTLQPYRAAGFP